MSWKNEAHVERLKEHRAAGLSAAQIAKALNREFPDADYSRNAVIGKATRLRLLSLNPSGDPGHVMDGGKAAPAPKTRLHPAGTRVYVVAADRPLPPEPKHAPGLRTILTIRPFECRFPIGDPRDADFTLCGQRADGRPYCDHHAARVYAPMPSGRPRNGNELARSLRKWATA